MRKWMRSLTRHAVIRGVLMALVAGCSPAMAPGGPPATPSAATPAGKSGAQRVEAPTPAAQPVGPVEKAQVKIGLPTQVAFFLPIYLAAEGAFEAEGLTVEVIPFTAGPALNQALASGSVDVGVAGHAQLITLIAAGQPATAFYSGFTTPDWVWFARPEVKTWADLRGKSVAVTQVGSLPDLLTRHVLRKHGLIPEQDVQLVQAGSAPELLAGLRAGRADAAAMPPPFTYQAAAAGFVQLGSQTSEVGERWPGVLFARRSFLDDYPNTARALLRAYVRAIRQAKSDQEGAVQTLMRTLKYQREDAERSYAEVVAGLDEQGILPPNGLPLYWELAVAAGEVTEPWPESRYFDRRFVDSFDQWKPR